VINHDQACDACHKSKRRCDGTGLACFSSSLYNTPVLIRFRKPLAVIGTIIADVNPQHRVHVRSYFASKACTYTDASGRPVPAPRPFKSDRPDPLPDARQQSFANQFPDRFPPGASHAQQAPNTYPAASSSTQPSMAVGPDSEGLRKRFRSVHGKSVPASDSVQLEPPPAPPIPIDRPAGLDHALTRELVNCKLICIMSSPVLNPIF
jgi:hypothetical protein